MKKDTWAAAVWLWMWSASLFRATPCVEDEASNLARPRSATMFYPEGLLSCFLFSHLVFFVLECVARHRAALLCFCSVTTYRYGDCFGATRNICTKDPSTFGTCERDEKRREAEACS